MKYQVLSPIKTADGIVTDGHVEIPDGEVEALKQLGIIGEAEPATARSDDSRLKALIDTISKLDKADASLWTGSGLPKTEALAAATGGPVTAAERDAAWATIDKA